MSETCLLVGVHEDNDREAERSGDFEEDRSKPVVAILREIVGGDSAIRPPEHEAGDE